MMRLLLVDFLDSYSHNIPSFLLRASSDIGHFEIHIELYTSLDRNSIELVAASYHGVILSAGPGTVECEQDLGSFVPALLSYSPAIPVYGICLGFQAICRHFGGTIQRLSSPHHGLVSDMLSLEGVSLGRRATRYHSLEARLDKSATQHLELIAVANNYDNPEATSAMEVRHRKLPFWGVQYHPESVNSFGCEVTVKPFLLAARSRLLTPRDAIHGTGHADSTNGGLGNGCAALKYHQQVAVSWKSIDYETDLLDVLPLLQSGSKDHVLLQSSSKGQWDILAAAETASLFRYSVKKQRMTMTSLKTEARGKPGGGQSLDRRATLMECWSFLADHSTRVRYVDGPNIPFWGGFLGYFGYELGLAQLGLDAYKSSYNDVPECDDIQLLWSTETLVYNRTTNQLYAISLTQDDSWVQEALKIARSALNKIQKTDEIPWTRQFRIEHPDGHSYIRSVRAAQEEIKAGNSYELCLTAPSITRTIRPLHSEIPRSQPVPEPSSIERFRLLRKNNPAEFMSAISLGGVEFLSASPEEFLSYDAESAIARMKPIKGTLPKKNATGESITYEAACKFLYEPKVIAENLMIVDLVRHDLSQVSNTVTCPDLMRVEDIGPMYQLVSTVQAEVPKDRTAWDLIRHSLPPGSMTGAPKRRSCEILQRLEQAPRGLYSGITGYVDVRGHCRTSVNIRNMVKYPGESHWRIGAGGAITSLSDPVDEWFERQLKASSVCRSLVPSFSILETFLWESEVDEQTYWNEHVERLLKSLTYFGFEAPTVPRNYTVETIPCMITNGTAPKDLNDTTAKAPSETMQNAADGNITSTKVSNPWKMREITSDRSAKGTVGPTSGTLINSRLLPQLYSWITERVRAAYQDGHKLRLSLTIDIAGTPSLTIVPIPAVSSPAPISVRLDPCAMSTADLEPFISHKTTRRGHYDAARERAGVQGCDEVLMFRPDSGATTDSTDLVLPGAATDLLTEGSYTNVAVWDPENEEWRTPGTGCLPGIMREKLLARGEIVLDDVRRGDLKVGTKVRMFNSVRGVFESIIGE